MKRWTAILALLLSFAGAALAQKAKSPYEGYSFLICKGTFSLSVLDAEGKAVHTFPVAIGENFGQKTKSGDCKTPEGVFPVTNIKNVKGVKYDYHDGLGPVEAYGPYFIYFDTPGFKYIGVHGTCPERDDRIGSRDSKGCIRLHNEDLMVVLPYAHAGMKIKVVPGLADIWADWLANQKN